MTALATHSGCVGVGGISRFLAVMKYTSPVAPVRFILRRNVDIEMAEITISLARG